MREILLGTVPERELQHPHSRQVEAIRTWLMERYGDYVSYKPVLSATTWPLFAVPAVLILAAGAVFARRLRRAR